MFLASFLIGLREGLEAALVISILLAYVGKLGRDDVKKKIWWGVGSATVLALVLGFAFTFGRYTLSFEAQEIIGGSMSLIAVGMITWMLFWMMKTGSNMKHELQDGVDKALALGTGWAIFWLAFVTVGREGIETTLMLWGWAGNILAFTGAVAGILIAVGLGYLLNQGMVRFNLRVFFTWTGAFLILVAAGVLAYGVHDLQEAGVLPGPFSGAPITPTDFRTGEVLTGITSGPYWMAAYPFGWAFNLEDVISPDGALAAFLKGTVGFVPLMSWLEVTAWFIYLVIVVPRFVRLAIRQARAAKKFVHSKVQVQAAASDQGQAASVVSPQQPQEVRHAAPTALGTPAPIA